MLLSKLQLEPFLKIRVITEIMHSKLKELQVGENPHDKNDYAT
jgi:hypothetical protein